jgi:uncharacterized protein
MKPRIGVITLGVDDLRASLKFYRDGLGLQSGGIIGTEFEHGAIVVFNLQHGVKLALFLVRTSPLMRASQPPAGVPPSSRLAITSAVKAKSTPSCARQSPLAHGW